MVKKAIERSLKNLGTDYIDLYYLQRLDPNTPIEETVGAMSELIKAGKVGSISLSEVSSETIKWAHKIHPLTAVQIEYSLFERSEKEAGILDTLEKLGIGFIAYSTPGKRIYFQRSKYVSDRYLNYKLTAGGEAN